MKEQGDTAIIISPEYEKMLREVTRLRNKVIELVLEKNELLYKKKPELLNIYMSCIGALENKLYELRMESIRIRYITELMRLNSNLSKKVDVKEIEEKADSFLPVSFPEEEIEEAPDQEDVKEEIDPDELKLLYRNVIKLLHPDIGMEDSLACERLLKDAIEAYEYKDIQVLKTIYQALKELGEKELITGHCADLISDLEKRICKLKDERDNLEQSLKDIKGKFPFDQEKLLTDPDRISKKQRKLEKDISAETEKLEKLKDRLRFFKIRNAHLAG